MTTEQTNQSDSKKPGKSGDVKNAGGVAAGGIDKSRFTQKLAVNRAKVKTSDPKKKDWGQEFSGIPLFVEQMPPVANRNTGELEAWYGIAMQLTSSCIVVEEDKERTALPGEIVLHGLSGHTKRLVRDIAQWAREGQSRDILFTPAGWQKVGENDMRVYEYAADPAPKKRGTGSAFVGGPEMKQMLQKMGVALDQTLPVALHDQTIAMLTAGGRPDADRADDDEQD